MATNSRFGVSLGMALLISALLLLTLGTQATACTSTTDTICQACTPCPTTHYESSACTSSSDRVCSLCDSCAANTFRSAPCTRQSNTQCTPCTACTTGQYMARNCTPHADAMCATCASCPAHHYEHAACTANANTDCRACSRCPAGQYQASACTADSDTVCTTCTVCASYEFVISPCTAEHDTICGFGSPDVATSLQIQIGSSDLLALQSAGFAAQSSDLYLAPDLALVDSYGNGLATASEYVRIADIGTDTLSPELQTFSADLNANFLRLSFSEAVNVSSFNTSALSLSATGLVPELSLRDTSAVVALAQNQVMQVNLSETQVDAIKSSLLLGRNRTTLYLHVAANLVYDFAGNVLTTPAHSLLPTTFQPDLTIPEPVLAAFNLSLGHLSITFDEVVSTTLLLPTALYCDGVQLGEITAAASTATLPRSRTMDFVLGSSTLNSIKANNAYVPDGTFVLRFPAGAASDRDGNHMLPVNVTASTAPDVVSPTLTWAAINFDSNLLQVEFDEPIVTRYAIPNRVHINDGQGTSFNMSGANLLVSKSQLATLYLPNTLIEAMKQEDGFATNATGLLLALDPGAFLDTSNNSNSAVAGFPLANYTADAVQPAPVTAVLDMNLGQLTLTFNESIQTNSINASAVQLYDQITAGRVVPLHEASILVDAVLISNPAVASTATVVVLELSSTELNQAKQFQYNASYLAVQVDTAFAVDVFGNPTLAQNLPLTGFVADSTSPTLEQLTVDLNASTITLQLSEAVDVGSFNLSALLFMGINDTTFRFPTLTPESSATSAIDTVFVFAIPEATATAIKSSDALFVQQNDTWALNATSSLVVDYSDNSLSFLPAPLSVSLITDQRQPLLVAYSLNMTNGAPPISITLTFNEPVLLDSSNWSLATLASAEAGNPAAETLSLADTVLVSSSKYAAVVTATLSEATWVRLTDYDNTILVSAATSYLNLHEGFVQDSSGQASATVANQLPASYELDLIHPEALDALLDMSALELSLTFSEPVILASLNASRLIVRSADANVSLAGSSVVAGGALAATSLTLELASLAAEQLKASGNFGTAVVDASVVLLAGSVTDEAENPARVAQLPLTSIVPDTTRPTIDSISLNMSSGVVQIRFSEPVNASSVDLARLFLEASANAATSLRLQDPSAIISVLDRRDLVIAFSNTQANEIRAQAGLARDQASSYFRFSEAFVKDMSGNPLGAQTLEVTVYHPDIIPPYLVSFEVDMSDEAISLTFSEPVNASTFELVTMVIVNRYANVSTNLSQATVTAATTLASSVTLTMSAALADDLKRQDLCSGTIQDCFLNLDAGYVTGADAIAARADALQATSVVADDQGPSLAYHGFSIYNADTAQLTMLFDESISLSSLNFSGFSLRSVFDEATPAISLSGAVALTATDGPQIVIQLANDTIDALQREDAICTIRSNCYLYLSAGAVQDRAGNPSLAVDENDASTLVRTFVRDTTAPYIVSYAFNMSSGELSLSYSEIVDGSLVLASLSLQGRPDAVSSEIVTLAGGAVSGRNERTMTVDLLTSDVRALKLRLIGTSAATLFLNVEAGAARDKAIPQNPSAATVKLPVSDYYADTIAPSLASFSVNLNQRLLTLVFAEPVLLNTFNAEGNASIVLQSMANESTESVSLTTTLDEGQDNVSATVVLVMTAQNVLSIKAEANLGTSTSNTFLSINGWILTDTSGNFNAPIPNNEAIAASELLQDATRVELVSFDLDFALRTVTLRFSDPVRASTFRARAVSFVSGAVDPASVALSTSTCSSPDGFVLVIDLSPADMAVLLDKDNFGDNTSNTFLVMSATAFDDVNGFDVIAVTEDAPMQASSVVLDTTAPTVVSVTIDLGAGSLAVNFSEPMLQALNATGVALTTNASMPALLSQELQLYPGSSSVQWSSDNTSVVLSLAQADAGWLKRAQVASGTFNASFPSLLGRDRSGIGSEASIVVITSVVLDTQGPTVLSYVLNMNNGSLTLYFDEPVLVASLNTSYLAAAPSGSALDILSQGVALRQHSAAEAGSDGLTVTLSVEERANLLLAGVGASAANTSFATEAGLVMDLFGNALATAAVLPNLTLFADEEAPLLVTFTLNMDDHTVVLEFSETLAAPVELDRLTLHNPDRSFEFSLENQTATAPTGVTLRVNLHANAQNAINLATDFGATLSATLISVDAGAVQDLSGVAINVLANRSADFIVADATAPAVLSVVLDLTAHELIYSFDEIINVSSVVATAVTMTINNTAVLAVTGAAATPPTRASSVTFGLAPEAYRQVLLSLNGESTIAASIDIEVNFARDVWGNGVVASESNVTIQADLERPTITSASLNLTTELVTIILSEPVQEDLVNVTGLTLCSDINCSEQIALTPSMVSSTTVVGDASNVVQIGMSSLLIDSIQASPVLGTTVNNTFFRAEAATVVDLAGNPLSANVLQASSVFGDTIPPVFTSISVNMTALTISVSFEEYVNGDALNMSLLLLHNGSDLVPVTGASIALGLTKTAVVQLDETFAHQILSEANLLISLVTSVFTLQAGFVQDAFANPNDEQAGVQAAAYTADLRRPWLEYLSLNLDAGSMTLVVSEPFHLASVNMSRLHLAGMDALTAASIDVFNLTTVTISLDEPTLHDLKKLENVTTGSPALAFEFDEAFLTDVAGNVMLADTLSLNQFVADSTGPLLEVMALNMNIGQMSLTFNEPVNPVSIDLAQLTFLGLAGVREELDASSATIVTVTNPLEIKLNLTSTLLNELRLKYLARDATTSLLNVKAGFVDDTTGNPLSSDVNITASVFVADATAPTITSYSLDLTDDVLLLTFSEVVNTTTFNRTALSLLDTDDSLLSLALTLVAPEIVLSQVIEADLSQISANRVKEAVGAAISLNTTRLVASDAFVQDTAGNPAVAITVASALEADVLVDDNRSATILNVELNLNAGTLSISFSESIDLASSDISRISAVGSDSAVVILASSFLNLSASVNDLIVVQLSNDDLNELKSLAGLAFNGDQATLVVARGLVVDWNGISSAASNTSLTAYVPDVSAPRVVAASLLVHQRELVLEMDEVLSLPSVVPASIRIMDGATPVALPPSSVPTVENQSVLVFPLDNATIESLKSIARLEETPYPVQLSLLAGAVTDMAGNDVSTTLKDFELVVADQDQAVATGFNFTQNAGGTMSIVFSEPINATTANASRAILLDARAQTFSLRLREAQYIEAEGLYQVMFIVSSADSNNIKAAPLCTAASDCFLSLEEGFILDLNGDPSAAVSAANALQTQVFQADEDGPVLQQFASLNLSTGVLVLSFNEPVAPQSVNFSRSRLESSLLVSSGNDVVILQAVLASNEPVLELRATLTTATLNAIKITRGRLCGSTGTCFLRLDAGFVTDTAGNAVAGTSTDDLDRFNRRTQDQPSTLALDQAGPVLQSFSLNMDTRVLTLIFDEPLDASTLAPTGLVVVQNNNETAEVPLSGSASTTVSGSYLRTVSITISTADLISIKADQDLATSAANTRLALLSGVISDLSANPNVATATPLSPTTFTPDSVAPTTFTFSSIDLNEGLFILTFAEPVDNASLACDRVFLANSASTIVYNLTQCSSQESGSQRLVLTLHLSEADLEAINRQSGLGTARSDSYLGLRAGAIADTQGNAIFAIAPIQASTFVALLPAELEAYTLDLNLGQLVLTFSMAMDESTLVPAQMQLQNNRSEAAASLVVVLGSSASVVSNEGTVLTIGLTQANLDILRATADGLLAAPLGAATSNTYLAMTSEAIKDVRAQAVLSVLRTNAQQAAAVVVDATIPELESFNMSMNAGTLNLVFSEPLLPNLINVTACQLVGLDNVSVALAADAVDVTAYTHPILQNAARRFWVTLSAPVLRSLKLALGVARNASTAKIQCAAELGTDVQLVPSAPVALLEPTGFESDLTAPVVTSVELDLTRGQVTVAFDEPVRIGNATGLALAASSGGAAVPLSFSGAQVELDTVAVLNLTTSALNDLKARSDLATRANNSWFQLPAGLVEDLFFNPSLVEERMADVVVSDSQAPEPTHVHINGDTGTLAVYFDEPVMPGLQQDLILGINGTNITLDAGSAVITQDTPTVIQFDMATSARNTAMIASNGQLASVALSLIVPADSVLDTTGNGNQAKTLTDAAVVVVSEDVSAPYPTSFVLDLFRGTLDLALSEPIRSSSVQLSLLGLTDNTTYVMFTGSSTYSGTTQHVHVDLAAVDLDAIKANLPVLLMDNTTTLFIQTGAFADLAGNLISNTSILSSFVNLDTNAPSLDSFTLVMDTGVLTLVFNETVNASSLQVAQLALQSSFAAGPTLPISASILTSVPDREVSLQLTPEYMNKLKNAGIISVSACWLVAEAGAVRDMSARPALPLLSGLTAKQAAAVTPDSVGPIIISFNVSLDTGLLYLEFNEPVDTSTFDLTAASLSEVQNRTAYSGVNTVTAMVGSTPVTVYEPYENFTRLGLTRSAVQSRAFVTVLIDTATLDLFEMRKATDFALNTTTAYFFANSSFVRDLSGNLLQATSDQAGVAPSAVEADSSSPLVTSYTLNHTANAISLIVLFDEPVASLNESLIRLGNSTYRPPVLPSALALSADGLSLTINLDRNATNMLKAAQLLQGQDTSALDLFDVADYRGNTIGNNALPFTPSVFVSDTVAPSLLEAGLNLNLLTLRLTFDEPLRAGVVPASISIGNGTFSIDLPSDTTVQRFENVVQLSLTSATAFTLRSLDNFADSGATSLLTFTSLLGADMFGNPVTAVTDFEPAFQSDTTGPSFTTVSLNLTSGLLVIEFDEPLQSSVNLSALSLDSSYWSLQGLPSTASAPALSGEVIDFTSVQLELEASVLDRLKVLQQSRIENGELRLKVTSRFVRDTGGTSNDAAQTTSFSVYGDTLPPVIVSSVLDLNNSQLVLNMSEVTQVDSLEASKISLKHPSTGSTVPLSSATWTRGSQQHILQGSLPQSLINELMLAFEDQVPSINALLVVAVAAVEDFAANDNAATEIAVSNVVADERAPVLESFTLNMNLGILDLTFNEIMDLASLQRTLFEIVNAAGESDSLFAP